MHKLSLFLTLFAAGCPGIGQVAFDVSSQGTSSIQGSPTGGLLPPAFQAFNQMNFSQNASFQNNNTDKGHVSSARLSKLTLKVVSPTSANLNFIATIEFDIQAPNQPPVRIAEATNIPAGSNSVDLTLDDVELAAYVKADSFSITTKATGMQPTQNTTLEADLTLHIIANVL